MPPNGEGVLGLVKSEHVVQTTGSVGEVTGPTAVSHRRAGNEWPRHGAKQGPDRPGTGILNATVSCASGGHRDRGRSSVFTVALPSAMPHDGSFPRSSVMFTPAFMGGRTVHAGCFQMTSQGSSEGPWWSSPKVFRRKSSPMSVGMESGRQRRHPALRFGASSRP